MEALAAKFVAKLEGEIAAIQAELAAARAELVATRTAGEETKAALADAKRMIGDHVRINDAHTDTIKQLEENIMSLKKTCDAQLAEIAALKAKGAHHGAGAGDSHPRAHAGSPPLPKDPPPHKGQSVHEMLGATFPPHAGQSDEPDFRKMTDVEALYYLLQKKGHNPCFLCIATFVARLTNPSAPMQCVLPGKQYTHYYRKKVFCKYLKSEKGCAKGKQCTFAHDEHDEEKWEDPIMKETMDNVAELRTRASHAEERAAKSTPKVLVKSGEQPTGPKVFPQAFAEAEELGQTWAEKVSQSNGSPVAAPVTDSLPATPTAGSPVAAPTKDSSIVTSITGADNWDEVQIANAVTAATAPTTDPTAPAMAVSSH